MTALLGKPIPPAPNEFTPRGAPPGVAVDLTALRGANGRPWFESRPMIRPRIAIVHTNGASVEASLQSSINHGNRAPNNTKPHYNVNAPIPTKVVPTDRRAIANSTGTSVENEHGERDVSFWSIAIETADAGYLASGGAVDLGDFLYDHAEIVARILAYESIVWSFPLTVPDVWNGTGVVTHTEPFPYPHYTTVRGKTCPGTTKKDRVLRGDILPRAREIAAAWTGTTPPPTPPEDDMTPRIVRFKGHPGRYLAWPNGTKTHIPSVAAGAEIARMYPEIPIEDLDAVQMQALGPIIGPGRADRDAYGLPI